jgi:hypothetical protein
MDHLNNILEIINSMLKPEDFADLPDAKRQLEIIFKSFANRTIDISQTKEHCRPYIKDPQRLDNIIEMLNLVYQSNDQQIPQQINGQRRKSRPWTTDEDERLTDAVNANGTSNWGNIAALVGSGRTKAQCSQRWNRVINPKISKATWTPEEEEKLIRIVQTFGTKQWTRVANEMGNRSDVQCRFKYNFIMNKRQKAMEAAGMGAPDN